jgi:hypothetical protein
MIKSLISALALSVLAVVGFAGVAQAQHKCPPPGTSTKGCYEPIRPTTPQFPSPKQ